jgi:pimeloyl-ACP methyl ester carboxylesterase
VGSVNRVTDLLTVEANGIKHAYRVSGAPDGPPVLLLHGLGGNGADWDEAAATLAATHRVYVLDQRGHGRSDWPGEYSLELMREDTLAFLDALGLGEVALVGHSMGALVGYLVAAGEPERITRLVLEEPPVPDPVHPRRVVPTGPADDDSCDWRAVAAVRSRLNAPDPSWWKLFAAITAPTLVVAGGAASTLSQDGMAAIADRVPDGRLVTIETGHLVHATRPAEFLAEVKAFLPVTG